MIDFNCFTGSWPFHPIRGGSFAELKRLHRENGISKGVVSSFQSLFYREFFLAEEELHRQLKDSEYRQVMTVNPAHPYCLEGIAYGLQNWNIAGVRLVPTYHGFQLEDPQVLKLCEFLEQYRLPLFLTLRMEDERVSYLLKPKQPEPEQTDRFLKRFPKLPILLCSAKQYELEEWRDTILSRSNIFYEGSNLKSSAAPLELLEEKLLERMVYGSTAPLLCLKSSLLSLQTDRIEENLRQSIQNGSLFYPYILDAERSIDHIH